jgi:hypothetical protein
MYDSVRQFDLGTIEKLDLEEIQKDIEQGLNSDLGESVEESIAQDIV